MNQSKSNGTKRQLHMPGNGEMRVNPMRARLDANQERTGISITVEEQEQEK